MFTNFFVWALVDMRSKKSWILYELKFNVEKVSILEIKALVSSLTYIIDTKP